MSANESDRRPTSSITLIDKAALAEELGVTPTTVERWVAQKILPPPIFPTDNGPARWRMRTIEACLDKIQSRRRKPPPLRGSVAKVAKRRRGGQ